MLRLMRVTIVSAFVTVCLAAPRPAAAQEVGAMPIPLVEVSAGYTFMRDYGGPGGLNYPAGWVFSGAFNPTTWLGIVGEVTGAYKNDLNFTGPFETLSRDMRFYTFMAGPRIFEKAGRVVPFAQVLVGAAHRRSETTFIPDPRGLGEISYGTTDFAIQPGGGLTVLLTEHVGVRLAADYRLIVDFDEDGNDYNHQFRVVSGFTFNWGAR